MLEIDNCIACDLQVQFSEKSVKLFCQNEKSLAAANIPPWTPNSTSQDLQIIVLKFRRLLLLRGSK